jgi:hypothetical protein
MPFFGKWEILETFLRGASEHPKKALFQKGSRIFNMSLSYDGFLCTTSLHTCLSTASSLLRRPLVLSLRWLVVACCIASIAGIFAACPSFG